ncbi:serine/threonine-protein kinase PknG [Granulicella rosea]|uniref:Serine/threonine-protein kinase PknG n=1 Tax=Granulicella rosea TaxID=474952 RepID=A0A239MIU8_9BACT|nr:serine/threonine-protein kinase [Granulicella rosea]SNT42163.1 serine/threonine-protein kinase PknG [Granulicella rosea]
MSGEACKRPGCAGVIEDGYCNLCGHAAVKGAAATSAATSAGPGVSSREHQTGSQTGSHRTSSVITTGTGSTPMSRASSGTRRSTRSSSRATRKQLGAGLITLPDLPSIEPERAIMLDPKVPERKRFCGRCDTALKREAGFCGKCGMKYSFIPSLRAGDVVAGQYAVKGPIAFGGLGWIYLAFDTLLSRYVVLKGLLNTQDESAAALAVAERQFLAAVKHPNIVGIYNFVQFGTEGFIVMEYVGGKTLKQIRQERGPLPPAEAIAYIHRILPCFAYLHRLGLVYCDFKPDNVMMERDDVKLLDLGGVRRMDDTKGDIYGTVGYSAPEAGAGPTAASDLYTVGRTLAVLLTDIRGFSSDHRYTLPTPQEEPKFAKQESLYRFLLKMTAENPDDRFVNAEEAAEQLLGVLREVVAVDTGTPHPGSSADFGPDLLALDSGHEMRSAEPDYAYLPLPAIDIEDPAAQAVGSANALADPERRVAALELVRGRFSKSREARLWLAAAQSDSAAYAEAEALLKALGEEDAWDWRVQWFEARMRLAQKRPAEARKLFDQVYFDLPGELAPKLALGLSAELAGDLTVASEMYDLVSQTDPGHVSAVFGLARCRFRSGDRTGAVAALNRIPPSSGLFLRSRVEAARMLVRAEGSALRLEDLASASALAESLALEEINKLTLGNQILTAAVDHVSSKAMAAGQSAKDLRIMGRPVNERQLRLGLESSLRGLARFMTGDERIQLVDQANLVRPRTLL